MSESQPEAKRQRIEQHDDQLTTTETKPDLKMSEETSKMEAEATAEGESILVYVTKLDRIRSCARAAACHFWRMRRCIL